MAERRMFSKSIIDSDMFLDMSLSAQALYFHLSMRGDDEGFINNPKNIIRMIGARDDDFKILVAKQFLIPFESGVVVIKHWKVHNYIRGDRMHETFYKYEKQQLSTNDNIYYLPENGENCLTYGSQLSDTCHTEERLGKDRLGKDKINIVENEKEIEDKSSQTISINTINNNFEELWKLYPIKEGKGNVKAKKKKELYKIGFDKMKLAIERYLKNTDLRRINFPDLNYKNGSTFFNSGYVDFIDDNFEFYKPKENTKCNQPIQSTNYEQREYSDEFFDSLIKNKDTAL